MEIRDLPPRKDPKGGSPKTPSGGIPVSQYQEDVSSWPQPVPHSNGVTFWRTIALVLIAANATGVAAFLTIGVDNIKHSEIDSIMATRAPYIHDKQRIQENFDELRRRVNDDETKIYNLEIQRRPASND